MKISELEIEVLKRMLADPELAPVKRSLDYKSISVLKRELTGPGFLTDFERLDSLRVFAGEVSLRWGKVGARLNESKTETAFLVYVDEGYVTSLEGYTYGEAWPERIDTVEFYPLTLGSELEHPPR